MGRGKENRWVWIWVGLAVLLVLVLYGPGLRVSFHKDDLENIAWSVERDWFDIWTKAHLANTYRPVIVSLRKILGIFQGSYTILPLKLLNLGLYTLNALMTGLMAAMWWRSEPHISRRAAAFLATVFFIAMPFAYESVPWASSIAHPLVTAFVLGAILAYDRARRSASRWWIAVVVICTLLGPLTHELGFLTIGFLFLLEIRARWVREYENIPYWAGGLAVAAVALYVLRRAVPGVLGLSDFPFTWEMFLENTTYLLQGVTYPTALISGALANRAGVEAFLSVWIVGLPTLLVLAALLNRMKDRVTWLMALSWLVVAGSVMVLFLRYLLIAPHYLVFLAPGVALVWSGALLSIPLGGQSKRVRRAVICGLVLLLVVPGLVPVISSVGHLVLLGEVLDDVAAAGRETTASESLLFVNMPYILYDSPLPYAVGSFETWVFLGPDFYPDRVIYMDSLKEIPTQSALFTNLLPEMPYTSVVLNTTGSTGRDWGEMVELIADAGDVYLAQYEPHRIYLLRAGRVMPGPPDEPAEPVATFETPDSVIKLLSAGLLSAKGRLGVRLAWLLPDSPLTGLEVFVHLYNENGELVSQADGPFLMGMYPLWLAGPGEYIEDYRYFSVPAAETYTIGIGLYDQISGVRLLPVDETGTPLEADRMVHLQVILP